MVSVVMYLIIGVITGILSSLFGFGGGFVVVPVLYWLLPQQGVPEILTMHVAIATSLAIMIINSTNSTISHQGKGNIIWHVFYSIAPSIAIGALIGGYTAPFLSGKLLRIIFIIFLVGTIISCLTRKKFITPENYKVQLPNVWYVRMLGLIIGFIATLLGVGGSVLIVPFLRNCKMRMQNAVALATPLSLPIAIVGAISYAIMGSKETTLPPSCFGFIHLPALVGIGLGGFAGVPIGTRITDYFPDKLFSQVYIGLLIVVTLTMLFVKHN